MASLSQIRRTGFRAGIVCAGRNPVSGSFFSPTQQFHLVIRIRRAGRFFVHAEPCERYSATREYPSDFRNGRVFRAYNANYQMIDAEVANGSEPEAVVEKLLQNPKTAFVHVRSVTHGCYTFGVERI
jgi:hypothetical protein